MPISLGVDSLEGDSSSGLGITNNSYASSNNSHNDYIIEFYKNGVRLTAVPQFNIETESGTVYVDQNGKFEIPKGSSINFTSSQDFNSYVNENRIDEIRISFESYTSGNDNTYKLYSETPGLNASIDTANDNTIIYEIVNTTQKVDEYGEKVYEIDPETGEYDLTKPVMVNKDIDNNDYTLTTFTSSALKEEDISIYWRDTGVNRPENITISLKCNDESYAIEEFEGISSNPDITTPTSNDTVYTYTVPEYDESGNENIYTSEITGSYPGYRYSDGEDANRYIFYSQRTFEFTLDWRSGNIDFTPFQEEVAQYLIDNFDFIDESDNIVIQLSAENIEYDAETNTVTIRNLDEIADDGSAKVYYLEIKNTQTAASGEGIGENDAWMITVENPGVNSAVTDRVYQDAVLSNTLSGKRDFTANIEWADADNAQARIENHSPTGNLVLWRYSDNNDPDKEERVAQVGTFPIYTAEDGYVSAVNIEELEKYDPYGYKYKYYVKEALVYSGEDPNANTDYSVLYDNGTAPYAEDNGTVTNHLTKDLVFTVDAKWIAAARQGGTASVSYELQKKVIAPDGTISWVRVPTATYNEYGEVLPDVMRDELVMSSFNAESMEKQDKFGPVPKYDDDGNAIEYRVVQVSLHRDDDSLHGDYNSTVVDDLIGDDAITVNGDNYEIRVVREGENYRFEYKLVGEMPVHIIKAWNDDANTDYNGPNSSSPTHKDDIIYALVNHYNFTTNEYENAMIDGNEYIELNQEDNLLSVNGKNETWKTTINVPMYDDEGHEYNYQILEHNPFSHYEVIISFDPATNTYTIANVFGTDGPPEIDLEKGWQDDGDMLHRTPVKIWVDPAVYTGVQSVTLQDTNMWLEDIYRNENYSYDPDHFKEYSSSELTDYRTKSQITAPNNTNDEFRWIYGVLTSRTNGNVSLKNKNPIGFANFVGIYRNANHYYAVQQFPDTTSNTNKIKFVNTRIGIVNYEIEFDWKVGNWISSNEDKKIKIRLTPYYEGQELDVEPVVQEIPISATKKIGDNNAKYIVTDLPKYDNQGRIINWRLEEITIADKVVTDGSCILKDELDEDVTCTISYTEPVYTNGTDHHSDDIISMKITNAFSGETQITIHKRWFDDSNKDGLRSDIYIKLYRTDHSGETVSVGNDYEWEFPEEDNNNYWTYTFNGLEKYDSDGYLLTYKVTELSVSNYKTEYYSSYNLEDQSSSVKSPDEFVGDGGTIVNTIYGEVEVKGLKLWQNISPALEKEHYPVAVIYLYRRVGGNSRRTRIGQTSIYNGDSNYIFTPDEIYANEPAYYVTKSNGTPKTRTDGSVVLPKYNEEGKRYYYSLSEETIKGYALKISNDKLVNEYNGGRPIQIKVTKLWENMNDQSIYPNIEITLHQVMFAQTTNSQGQILQNNGIYVNSSESTDPKLTFVSYTTYTKTLRKEEVQNNQWTYTFGEIQNGKEYIRKKTCVSLLRTVAALLISLPKASQIMKGQPSVLTLQMKTGIIWETSIML